MAATLIKILALCGVTQGAIARELGVTRAAVSLWASGKRHMSAAQEDRLLTWAGEVQLPAMVAMEAALAALPEGASRLTPEVRLAEFKHTLQQLWHDYDWERQPTRFKAGILAMLRRWGAYSQERDPATWDPKPEELDRLWEDTRQIRAWIATHRRLHTPPEREKTT